MWRKRTGLYIAAADDQIILVKRRKVIRILFSDRALFDLLVKKCSIRLLLVITFTWIQIPRNMLEDQRFRITAMSAQFCGTVPQILRNVGHFCFYCSLVLLFFLSSHILPLGSWHDKLPFGRRKKGHRHGHVKAKKEVLRSNETYYTSRFPGIAFLF